MNARGHTTKSLHSFYFILIKNLMSYSRGELVNEIIRQCSKWSNQQFWSAVSRAAKMPKGKGAESDLFMPTNCYRIEWDCARDVRGSSAVYCVATCIGCWIGEGRGGLASFARSVRLVWLLGFHRSLPFAQSRLVTCDRDGFSAEHKLLFQNWCSLMACL